MGKKCTKAEMAIRVAEVQRLLINASTRSQIVQHAAKKWGLGQRATDNLIRRARDVIVEDVSLDRQEFIAQKLSLLEQAQKECIKSNQMSNLVGCLRLQLQLIGVELR